MSAPPDDPLGAVAIDSGTGLRLVSLGDYLDAPLEEEAAAAALAWIKALRHAPVDGQPLRRRFRYRGDSLWWFTELYLHKEQVVLGLHRTILALERLVSTERPVEMSPSGPSRLLRIAGPQVARVHGVRWKGRGGRGGGLRLLSIGMRARTLRLAARASRLKRRPPPAASLPPAVAAFVHSAFWRGGAGAAGAEGYIGPVLDAIESRVPGRVACVGLGPAANFRARRWWHGVRRQGPAPAVTPVEAFAPLGSLQESERLWRTRHADLRALWRSPHVRRHAVIRGCDCWEAIREELAGVVLLQWTWSARAMDEAAAALDTLRPAVVLTYAEAGGWGRALLLEARRRRIPSAGLQHGFIYRHWLNYRHEPDEMAPDPDEPADAGFPHPTLTLLFDDFARQHLESQGRFPPAALEVTGSPRLDALVEAAGRLPAEAIARAAREAGAAGGQRLVLLVTKYREAAGVLPALVEAVAAMPEIQLGIKTHPAETAEVYAAAAARATNVRVLPPDAPLAPLLRASRAVVTVNSTVALDAVVLGIPALVLGLPNNLSPFVEAGLMAGVTPGESVETALRHILYDEDLRSQLTGRRAGYMTHSGIRPDSRSAGRSADAILSLASAGTVPGRAVHKQGNEA